MKRKAITFILLIVSFCVPNLATNAASAADYYIRRKPVHDGWCNSTGFSTHELFEWSVPPGDVFVHSMSSMNGVVFADETFLSGLSGTGATDATFFSPASYPFPQEIPYRLTIRQTWYTTDGGPFAQTLTELKCNKSGKPIVRESN